MKRREIMFVDGYNIIGAWPELQELQRKGEIEAARNHLLFTLSNYQKYKEITIIVVFDAQFVPGIAKVYEEYQVQVVFTKYGETADAYIEREVEKHINPLNYVVVATSDATEQWLIFQKGALRKPANELLLDLQYAKGQIEQDVDRYHRKLKRNNPWKSDQYQQLDELRYKLDGKQE